MGTLVCRRSPASVHLQADGERSLVLEELGPKRLELDGKGHNKAMAISVEGLYRNGKIELLEPVAEADGTRVIVTWVGSGRVVSLRDHSIDETQAADLRRRLAAFAEDWDRPEMSVYDELPQG